MDTTNLDRDLAEGRPPGGVDADVMRSRIATRMFGDLARPVSIGRYEIVQTLGAGGMGTVYLAHDASLDRDIALKVLHSGHAESRRHLRLVREAQALAKLSHPNVVQVFEVDQYAGQVYLTMEYVRGQRLTDWQRTKRSWREILEVYLQAAEGLAAAHGAGLVHRDFKPSNVLIGADGRVRVVDFGLARPSGVESSTSSSGERPPPTLESPLTQTGARVGTPAFMSPEQRAELAVDARSDQWSFCLVLWHALYGQRPEVADANESSPHLRIAQQVANVPRAIKPVLQRGLARDPVDRFPDMPAFITALRGAASGSNRRRVTTGVIAATIIAGVAVAWSLNDARRCDRAVGEIDAVWNAERHTAVLRAFRDHPADFAAAAAQSVAEAFDTYRDRWKSARTVVCHAAQSEGSAREIACLRRGQYRLAVASELLERADAGVLARSDALLAALGDPLACSDAPDQPTTGPEAAVLDLAAQTEMLAAAGDFTQASATIAAAYTAAVVLDRPLPLVRVKTAQGYIARESRHSEAARRDYLDAIGIAEANRFDRDAAELWLSIVELTAVELKDFDAARAHFARAEASVARIGAPSDLAARLALVAGMVAARSRSHDEARQHLDRAWRLADALDHEDAVLREHVRIEKSIVLLQSGALADAKRELTEIAELRKARLGPHHPELARIEINLGVVARAAEDIAAARAHFEAALRLQETAFGSESPRLSSALVALAENAWLRGDVDEAEALALRAAAVQRELPSNAVERGGGLALLALIAIERDRHDEAATLYAEFAEESRRGGRTNEQLQGSLNAAWCYLQAGRTAEARSFYAAMLALVGPDDPLQVWISAGLGRIEHLEGRSDRAIPLLEAALDAARAQQIAVLVPQLEWHLADALATSPRNRARALRLAESARAAFDEQWPKRKIARAAMDGLIERLKERRP